MQRPGSVGHAARKSPQTDMTSTTRSRSSPAGEASLVPGRWSAATRDCRRSIGCPGSPGVIVAQILPAYLQVVDALTPILRRLPGVIVTIDGRFGVGKTTLGRYLAWHFNVSLIETDLFLIPAREHLIHLDDQINRIIERRITTPRPVIVEGISMLQLMKRIHRVPDFSIYVTNPRQSSGGVMDRRLSAYEAAFSPSTIANIVVNIEH